MRLKEYHLVVERARVIIDADKSITWLKAIEIAKNFVKENEAKEWYGMDEYTLINKAMRKFEEVIDEVIDQGDSDDFEAFKLRVTERLDEID